MILIPDPVELTMGASNTDTTPTARNAAKTAGEEGRDLARSATDSTRQVAETAKEQTGQVMQEASTQARGLADQTRSEVLKQADQQRQRLAGTLRDSGRELSEFADRNAQSQLTTELSRRAGGYVQTMGDYLDNADPQRILRDVRSFARRRPGTFLTIAAVSGVIAGRLTRSIAAAQSPGDQSSDRHAAGDLGAQPPLSGSTSAGSSSSSVADPGALPAPPPPIVEAGMSGRGRTGLADTQAPRPDVLP
jgi:uncharacterized protein YjbJ (UPF0337 family)